MYACHINFVFNFYFSADMMIPDIGSNSNDMINCNGSEARLTDCPSPRASSTQPCSYLLVECVDTPPSVVPSPATVASGTPPSVVPSPATVASGTPETETPTASVVSSPELAGPESAPEGGSSPTTVIAVVLTIVIIAAFLLLFVVSAVVWKKTRLNKEKDHRYLHT